MARTRTTKDDIPAYLGISGAYVIGHLGAYTIPVFVGPMMTALEISELEIGVIAGAEAAGIAVATLFLAGRTAVLDLRRLALWGVAVAVLGQLLIIASDSYPVVVAARFITGLGAGATIAAANTAGAASANSERAFGVAQLLTGLVTMVVLTVAPIAIEVQNYKAGIACLVAVYLCFALMMCYLPSQISPRPDALAKPKYPHPRLAVALLLAFAIFLTADIATWLFTEQIGLSVGLTAREVGFYLSATVGVGLLGPILAIAIHTRFGRALPISVGMLALCLSIVGLVAARSPEAYVIALLPMNMGFAFITPYFLGTLSAVDETGAWTTLSSAVVAGTGVLGPIASGAVAAQFGYEGVAILAVPSVLLAWALALISLRAQVFRRAAAAAAV